MPKNYNGYPELPSFKDLKRFGDRLDADYPTRIKEAERIMNQFRPATVKGELTPVRESGNYRNLSTRSQSSSREIATSSSFRSVTDRIVDLDPSEWQRTIRDASRLSPAALRQLVMRIIRMSARRQIAFQLLEWALKILRDLNEKPDVVKTKDGTKTFDLTGYTVNCGSPAGNPYLFGPPSKPPSEWDIPGCSSDYGGPTQSDNWHVGAGPRVDRIGVAAGRTYFREVWGTMLYIDVSPPLGDESLWSVWSTCKVSRSWSEPGALDEPQTPVGTFVKVVPGMMAPPLPGAAPQSWFNPDSAKPGQAVSPTPPPVAGWSRASSSWPQGRQADYVAPAARGRSAVDIAFEKQTWTFDGKGPVPPSVNTIVKFPDRSLPPYKTREKKVRFVAGGVPRRILDFVGESADFIEALWEAIPKKYRKCKTKPATWPFRARKPPPQCMLKDIYAYWPHMDREYLSRAMAKVFANQVEDMFYGTIGHYSGKAGGAIGRPVGVQTGPAL